MIGDCDTNTVDVTEGSIRGRRDALFLNLYQQLPIKLVQSGTTHIAWIVSITNNIEADGRHQFKVFRFFYQLAQILSLVDIFCDHATEFSGSVLLYRHPDF